MTKSFPLLRPIQTATTPLAYNLINSAFNTVTDWINVFLSSWAEVFFPAVKAGYGCTNEGFLQSEPVVHLLPTFERKWSCYPHSSPSMPGPCSTGSQLQCSKFSDVYYINRRRKP